MIDSEPIYPKNDLIFALTKDMVDDLVSSFKNQNFTKESANLTNYHKKPEYKILHHFPSKENIEDEEVKKLRNGYKTDTLTSVDIQKNVENGRKGIEICERIK